MHLYTDESGDFLFPDDRFDCYSQAVVICPDSCLGHVEDFVSGRRERWDLEELHAHRMTGQMLLEVCEFIPQSGCGLLAMVTDSELVSADDIFRFRLAQAAANKPGLDRYHAEGGRSEEIAAFTDRNIKRVGLEAQIQDGQFIQAHFLVLLLGRALQKAVLWYQADEWDEDLGRFTFVADRKLPGKMSMGEKYIHEVIVSALASREGALDIPEAWHRRPDHPFLVNFEREHARVRGRKVAGAIDLGAIFEGGVRFEDSREQPGLQLADVIAHVVRRAVLEPENTVIQAAYEHLRPQLRNEDDRCLLINRLQRLRSSGLARALPARPWARAGSARRSTRAMMSASGGPLTMAPRIGILAPDPDGARGSRAGGGDSPRSIDRGPPATTSPGQSRPPSILGFRIRLRSWRRRTRCSRGRCRGPSRRRAGPRAVPRPRSCCGNGRRPSP